jgi:WD40 repeat protein
MNHSKSSLLFIVFLLGSIVLAACSFSVEIMSPAATLPAAPSPTAAPLMTASPTPTFPPTEISSLPTPTLISIREGTYPLLEIVTSVGDLELPRALAFSPDGAVLAAAGGNTEDFAIHLWDVVTGSKIGTLGGHSDIVWGLAFSSDGQMLVSVSSDGTAIVRDWRNGDILKVLNFPGEVVSVSFSPDGQTLAVGGVDEPVNQVQNAAIWTFTVGSWEPQVKFAEYWNIQVMNFSPDGALLAGGGTSRNVQVWRASDGTPLYTLNHAHQVARAAVSPDGSTLATGTCATVVNESCREGSVWLWDLPSGRLLRKLAGLTTIVDGLAYTADGTSLLVGTRDGLVRIYATSDYEPRFEIFSPGGISALALSVDNGLLATAGGDGKVHIWKVVYRP